MDSARQLLMHTDSVCNENSTHRLIVESFGYDGQPEAPLTFTWSLHDVVDGAPLSVDNSESPASSVTIIIAHALNQILHDAPYEKRVVTVTTTFGAGEQLVDQHPYLVRNLYIPAAL